MRWLTDIQDPFLRAVCWVVFTVGVLCIVYSVVEFARISWQRRRGE